MRPIRSALTFASCFLLAILCTSGSTAFGQTVQIGGFNVEFWSQADGDAEVIFGTLDQNFLDTFNQAEIDAITRAFEYWSDKLNLSPADADSPVIRVVKDAGNVPSPNAFAISQTNFDNAESQNNTYTRLVTMADPTRSVVGMETPIDGAVVFNEGFLAAITDQITQLPNGAYDVEMIAIHEIGHLLGFSGGNAPFTDHLTPNGGNFLFGGAPGMNAEAVYGAAIPIFQDRAHTLLPYANLTRALVLGEDYRNIPYFSPAELAILADMGYNIDLANEFGATYYQNGVTDTNMVAFNSTNTFGLGMFIEADNLDITQAVDINANGFAAAGIRIGGGFNNLVTLNPGVSINANGTSGIGIFGSGGANHHLVLRGDVSATGTDGVGLYFNFGPTFLFSDLTSSDFGAPLISQIDITGSITGNAAAINITETAGVGEINIMSGASINGNIVSDALIDPGNGVNRPTINFGYQADANGQRTNMLDNGFDFTYGGNITGGTRMDANLVAGRTTFNGNVEFNSLDIAQSATLGGNGTIASSQTVQNDGTIAPGNSIGTLTINGNLANSSTSTLEVEINDGGTTPGVNNDLLVVTGSATIDGGTIEVLDAPGNYTPGSVYTFLQTGGGITLLSDPTINEDISNIRILSQVSPFDFSLVFLNDGSFGPLGRTYNQRMWGRYFDGIKDDPNPEIQLLRNTLDMLPNDDAIRSAMDQMTGELYGTMAISSVQNVAQVFSVLAVQTRNHVDVCEPWYNDLWYIGYGTGGTGDNDGNAHDADFTNWGHVLGWTESPDCETHYGLFYNIGYEQTRVDSTRSHGEVQSQRIGTFFGRRNDRGYVSLTGLLGWDDLDSRRNILVGPLAARTEAEGNGWHAALNLEQGLDYEVGPAVLQPYGNIQYIHVDHNGLNETGAGLLDLHVTDRNVDSFRTRLGGRINLATDSKSYAFNFDIAWVHEYADQLADYNASFRGAPQTTFNARGLDLGSDWINLGPSMKWSYKHLNLYADYQAAANGDYVLHSGSGSAEVTW